MIIQRINLGLYALFGELERHRRTGAASPRSCGPSSTARPPPRWASASTSGAAGAGRRPPARSCEGDDRRPDPCTTGAHLTSAHRALGRPRRRRRVARVHPDVDCYAENPPVIVESGRGPRADRRRRPPLPRRHLVAVGHHARPPGARARPGRPRAARPGRPHHAARQRQPGHHRAGRGAGPAGAGGRAPLPVRLRRRRRRRAGPQDRLPVLDQPGRHRAAPATSPSAAPTTATPSARSRSGAGGFGTDVFDPLRFPVLRAPGYDDPGWADTALRADRRPRRRARRRRDRAARAGRGRHAGHRPRSRSSGSATPASEHDVLLIADEVATGFGRTGTLFASEQCGIRPDLLTIGKGLTGGYLPMAATVASRRVYDAFLGPDLSELTLYHGHSFSRERPRRRGRPPPPRAVRRVGRARQRARAGHPARRAARRSSPANDPPWWATSAAGA